MTIREMVAAEAVVRVAREKRSLLDHAGCAAVLAAADALGDVAPSTEVIADALFAAAEDDDVKCDGSAYAELRTAWATAMAGFDHLNAAALKERGR